METIRKAKKIHKCDFCAGNIQKGEKYIHAQYKIPSYEDEINPDLQTGIWYESTRQHNKDCWPRLLYSADAKNILKNCNFGIHKKTWDRDPDSCDDSTWCEWCGKELK